MIISADARQKNFCALGYMLPLSDMVDLRRRGITYADVARRAVECFWTDDFLLDVVLQTGREEHCDF